METFFLIWQQVKDIVVSSIPVLTQVVFVYLILRFTLAVATTIVQVSMKPATSPAETPEPEEAAPEEKAEPPQLEAEAAPPSLPESTSEGAS